jgi:hypothetical protein
MNALSNPRLAPIVTLKVRRDATAAFDRFERQDARFGKRAP